MNPQNFHQQRRNPQRNNPQLQERYEFKFEIQRLLDDGGNIPKNLVADIGEKNVKELASALSAEKLTSNQARKFYDAFIKIRNQQGSSDDAKKIQLLVLKAQSEYSYRRKTIKDGFKAFLENRINLVTKSSDFKRNLEAFRLHFESLIAYLPK